MILKKFQQEVCIYIKLYSLVNDYTDQLNDYTHQFNDYTDQLNDYTHLFNDYTDQLNDYTHQLDDYTHLFNDYTDQLNDYTHLLNDYTHLFNDYTHVFNDYTYVLMIYTAIEHSCDTSQTIQMYLAITNQSESANGSPDFHLASHLPLSVASTLLKADENVGYFNKVQITPNEFEGIVWLGSTFHAIHGNYHQEGITRLDLWWVLEIEGMMDYYEPMDPKVFVSDDKPLNYYLDGFDWCRTNEQYQHWFKQQKKITMTDIQKNIDQSKIIQWNFNTQKK